MREKVDRAKAELPEETDEPMVEEVNLSLFPVLVVTLAGAVPERTLLALARDLQDRLEALPDVLEVEIGGDREEVVEIVIDPLRIEAYDLAARDGAGPGQAQQPAGRRRRLGRRPGPVRGQGAGPDRGPRRHAPACRSRSRATGWSRWATSPTVRRTFKDPEGFARVDGRSALALEVKKRIGRNIIETIEQVRAVVEAERARWPATIEVGYLQDKSNDIRNMLDDLGNNVLTRRSR